MSTPINPYESPAAPISAIVGEELQQHGKLKSARLRGWAAIVALAVNIALAIAGLLFAGRLFAAYTGIVAADYMDAEWAGDQLAHLRRVFVLIMCCRLLTAVAVIAWMYQCHHNLIALGHRELDSKPIWVVLCWFVPLMNFFCPYQVMQEIWRRSDPHAIRREPDLGTPLVTSWWLTWLAAISLVTFANHINNQNEMEWDQTHMVWLSGADGLHFIMTIVAALLLIAIIVKLNHRQVERSVTLATQNSEAST